MDESSLVFFCDHIRFSFEKPIGNERKRVKQHMRAAIVPVETHANPHSRKLDRKNFSQETRVHSQ